METLQLEPLGLVPEENHGREGQRLFLSPPMGLALNLDSRGSHTLSPELVSGTQPSAKGPASFLGIILSITEASKFIQLPKLAVVQAELPRG